MFAIFQSDLFIMCTHQFSEVIWHSADGPCVRLYRCTDCGYKSKTEAIQHLFHNSKCMICGHTCFHRVVTHEGTCKFCGSRVIESIKQEKNNETALIRKPNLDDTNLDYSQLKLQYDLLKREYENLLSELRNIIDTRENYH